MPVYEKKTKFDQRNTEHVGIKDDFSDSSSVIGEPDLPLEKFWAGEFTFQGRVSGPEKFASSFVSHPPPPPGLWDTDNECFLDKVSCQLCIRLTHINPKNGRYDGRMKFHWEMREMNLHKRTEPLKRVPGIRMPGLFCEVEESRIWRRIDLEAGQKARNLLWQGITVLTFHGYELFEVDDFPFDRQVIDLNLFEFVWRENKDTDCFFESMRIVSFTVKMISMLPEWDCAPAIVEPTHILQHGSGPSYATRFIVKLRVERKEKYYIYHIFMVSSLITAAALFPLALVPTKDHAGDRLIVQLSGLLTLISFKYSVSNDLPIVPYPTFISNFMQAQIVTLVCVSIEGITAYRITLGSEIHIGWLEVAEDILMCTLLLVWLLYFLYAAFGKRRRTWRDVVDSQSSNIEIREERRHTGLSNTSNSLSKDSGRLQINARLFSSERSGEQVQNQVVSAVQDTLLAAAHAAAHRNSRKLNGIAEETTHVTFREETDVEANLNAPERQLSPLSAVSQDSRHKNYEWLRRFSTNEKLAIDAAGMGMEGQADTQAVGPPSLLLQDFMDFKGWHVTISSDTASEVEACLVPVVDKRRLGRLLYKLVKLVDATQIDSSDPEVLDNFIGRITAEFLGYKNYKVSQGSQQSKPRQQIPRTVQRKLECVRPVKDPEKPLVIPPYMDPLLHSYGLYIVEVPRDGNCQFHALAFGCKDATHKQVRQKVTNYLRVNRTRYQGFVDGVSYNEYVEKMTKDGCWGDNLTLDAFANCYKRSVNILHLRESSIESLFVEPGSDIDINLPPVHVFFIPERHYNAIVFVENEALTRRPIGNSRAADASLNSNATERLACSISL